MAVPVAPPALLEIISCSCKAGLKPCTSAKCSCAAADLVCTSYCFCKGHDRICCNLLMQSQQDKQESGEEDDEVDDEDEIVYSSEW